MRFAEPHILLLLALAPVLFWIVRMGRVRRERRMSAFADKALHRAIAPHLEAGGKWNTDIIPTLVFVALTLALARPQWGFVDQPVPERGLEIAIALDVSDSMLATDVAPNRLQLARRKILDLLQQLRGDRIALVSFAGAAYIESPLTSDYGAFRTFLDDLSPDLVPVKGTNVAEALNVSLKALAAGDDRRSTGRQKAIILITDGESFTGDLKGTGAAAQQAGVNIFVLGVGTASGGPIPIKDGYKRGKDGKVVISKLNEPALRELAQQAGGSYVTALQSDRDTVTIFQEGIRPMLEAERKKRESIVRVWNEYFQLPLGAALLLLAATELRRRAKSVVVAAAMLVWFVNPSYAESAELAGSRAAKDFQTGDFEHAADAFAAAATKQASDARFLVGQAAALYRLEKFEDAKAAYLEAAARSVTPNIRAEALYGAGNAMAQLEAYKDAVGAYEEALKITPSDEDTKANLEYVKRLLEQKKNESDKKDEKNKGGKQSSSSSSSGGSSSTSSQQSSGGSSSASSGGSSSSSSASGGSGSESSSSSSPGKGEKGSSSSKSESKSQGSSPAPSDDMLEQDPKDQGQSSSQDELTDKDRKELEAVLGSIEENRESLKAFRMQSGQQERRKQREADQDW